MVHTYNIGGYTYSVNIFIHTVHTATLYSGPSLIRTPWIQGVVGYAKRSDNLNWSECIVIYQYITQYHATFWLYKAMRARKEQCVYAFSRGGSHFLLTKHACAPTIIYHQGQKTNVQMAIPGKCGVRIIQAVG